MRGICVAADVNSGVVTIHYPGDGTCARELPMSLSALVATSRRMANTELAKPIILNPAKIAGAAISGCAETLSRRGQTVEIEHKHQRLTGRINQARLIELLGDAILDISSLSPRDECLKVGFSGNLIAISGRNPIDLPDSGLELDKTFRLRAFMIKVGVALAWEQGRGPVLMLTLPVAARSAGASCLKPFQRTMDPAQKNA
jgi:hypothetical protein